MKRILLIAMALLLCSTAMAQESKKERRFSFSVGYRVGLPTATSITKDEYGEKYIMGVEPFSHFVSLDFNYAISPKWEVGLATGINDTRISTWSLPLYANAQFFFNDRTRGWFNYVDVGTNMNLKYGFNMGALAGFGGGYRLYIANKFKMDFSLGYVYNYIPNIPQYHNAIQLGVALVF